MPVANPDDFLKVVKPCLCDHTADGLATVVKARWRSEEICPLLSDARIEVRQVACTVLGLVGDRGSVGCLSRALHDSNQLLSELAEHALWSVWFRLGKDDAQHPFQTGINLLEAEQPEAAMREFRKSIGIDPSFAEAYNQAAICCYELQLYEKSAAFCQQAIDRMPVHFGAVAGKGHCLAQLGYCQQALDAYRQAVAINPRMTEIQQAIANYGIGRSRGGEDGGANGGGQGSCW